MIISSSHFGYTRMFSRLCLGLLLCMTAHGKVTLVAPGSDVSDSCVGSWDRTGPGTELKLDNKAHLLVQNFQHNKERYKCADKEITLERKHASAGDTSLLYRAVGQPVHLFCKSLGTETCQGTWNWTPHHASNRPEMTQNSGRDGDYSLNSSSVRWEDSGEYSCQMQCKGNTETLKQTSYELVVVNATVEPQRVYEGDDVTLRCSLSHLKTPGQVCWIYLDTINHYSRRYRSYSSYCETNAAALSHTVSNIRSDQSQWACAVFYKDTMRALQPVQLNVFTHTTTQQTTTHTPSTHTTMVQKATTLLETHSDRNSTATRPTNSSAGVNVLHVSVMSVCGTVVFSLVALTALLLWKLTNKEVCEDEDERKTADEEASPHRGSVTYASVQFKRKPTEDLNKVSSDVAATDPAAAAGGTEEEDATVI